MFVRVVRPMAVLAALVSGANTQLVLADARLDYITNRAESKSILVREGVVRLEDAQAEASYFLIDSSFRNVAVVDDAAKTFHYMNREKVAELQGQMAAARKEMQVQMQNLPPEQREAMLAQFPQFFQEADKPKIVVVPTTEKRKISGIDCTVVNEFRNQAPSRNYCVAKPENLGIAEADYTAINAMVSVFNELGDSFDAKRMMPDEGLDDLGGLPIFIKQLESGNSETLRAIKTDALAPELFQIPEGYRQINPFKE